MGSKLIEALQYPTTLERFEPLVGKCTERCRLVQKDFAGRRFKVGFQSFKRCDVVCLPHPSSSQGLSDGYIALFSGEMEQIMSDYIHAREVAAVDRMERKILDRLAGKSS